MSEQAAGPPLMQIGIDLSKLQQAQLRSTRDVLSAVETLEVLLNDLESACVQGSEQSAQQALHRFNPKKVSDTINSSHKTYHAHISKFLKLLEKQSEQEDTPIVPETEEMRVAMIGFIAKHMCWHGYSRGAEVLHNEAHVEFPSTYAMHALEVHTISEALKSRDVQPAENWLETYRSKLDARTVQRLEFELAQMKYLQLVQAEDPAQHIQAVRLAQELFPPFYRAFSSEVHQLMGALLFAGNISNSQYSRLVSDDQIRRVSRLFLEAACRIRRLPLHSLLETTVDAGTIAVPTFAKISGIMKTGSRSWENLGELPVEILLPKRFQYHSVFSCPVSREQPSPTNSPVLLKCNHVILRSSMDSIVKRANRFKCPTCYAEMMPGDVMPIFI